MLILTERSTVDEVAKQIFSDKIIWFYDGEKYHQVMAFKDEADAITIFFFTTEGTPSSYRFGDK